MRASMRWLLLLLALSGVVSDEHSCPLAVGSGNATSLAAREWIVMFRDYALAAEHAALVAAALNGAELRGVTWRVVPRRSRAAQIPSDFALLAVSAAPPRAAGEAALLRSLRASPLVRHVTPQRAWTAEPGRTRRSTCSACTPEDGRAASCGSAAGVGSRALLSTPPPDPPPSDSRAGAFAARAFYPRLSQLGGGIWAGATPDLDSASGSSPPESVEQARSARRREPLQFWGRQAGAGEPVVEAGAGAGAAPPSGVAGTFYAHELWAAGFTGRGVRVAVFDSGLRARHPHFRKVKDRSNWTDEKSRADGLGHGTFVAGVIASTDVGCPGFAPDAELYIFRVFTSAQVSYTSWFLDAFNYALHLRVHVLNLSVGGPDFLDRPFYDKVTELSAAGIVVVSATGNDGPLYGTLTSPADQLDVVGVGGLNNDDSVAPFSSRGMTTAELPRGYGRFKPDVAAYAQNVRGSTPAGGCRSLSGTSVASPVVAGGVALLASILLEGGQPELLNAATIKQALMSTSDVLQGGEGGGSSSNIFEQGAGRMNLVAAAAFLQSYTPRATLHPPALDFTESPCRYMWPFCSQPLYAGALPVVVNVTILNGLGVVGSVPQAPLWQPGTNGDLLLVTASVSDVLWPWSGALSVFLRVRPGAAAWSGVAEGTLLLTVESPPAGAEASPRREQLRLHIRLPVVPTPPRAARVLWDQFHNVRYPSAYVPRDSLAEHSDMLDWNGDHPHTNFRGAYHALRAAGYFVEVMGTDWTCAGASALAAYGTLLLVDLEDEFFVEEAAALRSAVAQGLSVVVFADWYNGAAMDALQFFDENTRESWPAVAAGANLPALNALLAPFGVAFGNRVYAGQVQHFDRPEDSAAAGSQQPRGGASDAFSAFTSGASIARFPAGGYLVRAGGPGVDAAYQLRDETDDLLQDRPWAQKQRLRGGGPGVPILGLLQTGPADGAAPSGAPAPDHAAGRIVVYGDAGCLDDVRATAPCWWLLERALDYASRGVLDPLLAPESARLSAAFVAEGGVSPPAPHNVHLLRKHSRVLAVGAAPGGKACILNDGRHAFDGGA